jgi:hypothetical protein
VSLTGVSRGYATFAAPPPAVPGPDQGSGESAVAGDGAGSVRSAPDPTQPATAAAAAKPALPAQRTRVDLYL